MRMNDSTKNLILIGMPGSGKSSVGVILAKVLGMNFIDSDLLIQQEAGSLLADIIQKEGLEGFIRLEERINSSIQAENSVIATGGSAVFGEAAMLHLKRGGTVIYLEAAPSILKSRIGDLDKRGVIHKNGQTLSDIYEERKPLYEKYADITVREDSALLSIDSILREILEAIKTSSQSQAPRCRLSPPL